MEGCRGRESGRGAAAQHNASNNNSKSTNQNFSLERQEGRRSSCDCDISLISSLFGFALQLIGSRAKMIKEENGRGEDRFVFWQALGKSIIDRRLRTLPLLLPSPFAKHCFRKIQPVSFPALKG